MPVVARLLRLFALMCGVALTIPFASSHAEEPPAADICRENPAFRAQDFTLGDWDVYAGETRIARVTLEPILESCAIEETWTVTGGRTRGNGLGIFNYSALLGHWMYHWVTDDGASTTFTGEPTGPGAIRYVTRKPLGEGPLGEKRVRLRHWTLTRTGDGGIRELSVGSEDDGATWEVEYDLHWVPHT
ncbi:hypothetical protein [Novosphingobium profundi]|uniref:hypothetical protein n=1 Tax=Novosphingobium profundi TaxID=1774954 RepID=UPI001CFED860|nr:hypothetical protein [Novosphingobium profundi]